MTMLIIATATETTAAVNSTRRLSALVGWWSAAVDACMAARIIGTGRPVVHSRDHSPAFTPPGLTILSRYGVTPAVAES